MDSEFYLIEKKLAELGYARHPGETLSDWVRRIEGETPTDATPVPQSILTLHYRYRFDPKGITSEERSALKSTVNAWLDESQINIQPEFSACQKVARKANRPLREIIRLALKEYEKANKQ